MFIIFEAAFFAESTFVISIFVSSIASGTLGVTTDAIGINIFFTVSIASSFIKLAPPLAFITGSTTILIFFKSKSHPMSDITALI